MCPAGHLEPGVVQAFSSPIPGLLDVGRFPSGTDERSHGLAEAFRSAGFDSIEREDVMRWKYCKLLMNLGNAVEAAFLPSDRAEVSALARDEGMACLQAAGIAFASAEEDGARRGTLMKLGPVGGRRREGGSSWQSLQRGTGSIESDYLNGEVVLLGRIHGVPTPVNALLQEVAWEMAWSGAEPATLSAAQFFDRLGSHSERP
jgi:2-dehydropantoate 2-reductase